VSNEPKLLVYLSHQKPSPEAMISADMVVEVNMAAQTATVISREPFDDPVLRLPVLPMGYDIKIDGVSFIAVLDEPGRQHVGPVREHAVEAVVDAWKASVESRWSLAITAIAAERSRQMGRWSAEHDDEHGDGELAVRGAELALVHTDYELNPHEGEHDAWGLVAKHRGDPVRCLTIAGALIAAELDRVLRQAQE